MAQIARLFDFQSGTTIKDSEVDAELNQLVNTANDLDETNFSGTGISGLLPWTIDIDPFTTPATQTNWSTIGIDPAQIKNGSLASTGAQSAQIGWDVVMAAGTWTLNVLTITILNAGIIGAALGPSPVGVMDTYSAGTTYNVSKSITGIVVSTTGKKRLTLTMATKNDASSGYFGRLSAVRLLRTA